MSDLRLSNINRMLEDLYNDLNRFYYDSKLEPCIITVQSKGKSESYGWFSCGKVWSDKDKQTFNEINISSEHLASRGAEGVLSTLLHEMVHKYCSQFGVQDTSRNGRYHNKTFKQHAESHGLIVEYSQKIGWSSSKLNESSKKYLNESKLIQDINLERATFEVEKKKKSKSNSIKYTCSCCGAIARTTKPMTLICGECDEVMLIDN